MNKHKREECEVFGKFRHHYPCSIKSFHEGEDPPDISCELLDGTTVNFELVECVDQSLARARSECIALLTTFYDELEKHPESTRINEELGGRGLRVDFRKGTALRTKQKALSAVVARLAQLPRGYSGRVGVRPYNLLRKTVERLELVCESGMQLLYHPNCTTSFEDVTVRRLKRKFHSIHGAGMQLELLAYYRWVSGRVARTTTLPAARKYIEGNINNSPFCRVWLYSVYDDEVLYVHPPV